VKSNHRPVIIGFLLFGLLDVVVLALLIAVPNLAPIGIPALAAIQILGFAVFTFVSTARNAPSSALQEPGESSSNSLGEWALWLFACIAMLHFLRAGLDLLTVPAIAVSGLPYPKGIHSSRRDPKERRPRSSADRVYLS
jgi:hypothetical protein